MALMLASLELAFLCLLTLCLALIPQLPVPRAWSLAAGALVAVQTAAVHDMRLATLDPLAEAEQAPFATTAEVVGLLIVPALTAALLVAVTVPLARANGRTRRRLRAAMARGRRPAGAPR